MMKLTNKKIADDLRKVAANYPAVSFVMKKHTVYINGSFKVRCVESAEAINKIADRFEKGITDVGCFKLPKRIPINRESLKLISNRYKDDSDLDQFKLLLE